MFEGIQNLINDHNQIKRIRNVAKRCSDLLYKGKNISYDDIKELIIIIEEFIDKCHHSKEECSLFQTVVKDDDIDKEINALLIEHEFGRRVVNMIEKALNSWVNENQIEPIARLLNAYVTFLDLHMEREERFFVTIDNKYRFNELVNSDKFNTLTIKMLNLKNKIDALESKEWYKTSN